MAKTIRLNDQELVMHGQTLLDLLNQIEREPRGIAIALDQMVVPKDQWDSRKVSEQSEVLIFETIAGG